MIENNASTWIINNFNYEFKAMEYAFWINIVQIVVAILILLHSARMHKLKFKGTIRLQTDVACVFTILSGISYFVSRANDSPINLAINQNLLNDGIFALPIHLCDNYMFVDRLKIVSKIKKRKSHLIDLYIIILLVLTWLPFYTIVPFFSDTNTGECFQAYFKLSIVWITAYLLYNTYFTWEFILIMKKHLFKHKDSCYLSGRPAKIIAIKSFGHGLTSSIAVVLNFVFLFYTPYKGLSTPIFNIIIIGGLHFWFNINLEKLACFKVILKRIRLLKAFKVYASFSSSKSGHGSRSGSVKVSIRSVAGIAIPALAINSTILNRQHDYLLEELKNMQRDKNEPSDPIVAMAARWGGDRDISLTTSHHECEEKVYCSD